MFGLLAATSAHALQQDLDEDQLDALAVLVVTGEVTTLERRWAAGPVGGIETVAWVAVDAVRKGPAVDGVEIVLDGGALGIHQTIASDSPELWEDVRYALRLVRDDEGRWRVLGGERGARPLGPVPLAYRLSGWDWSWQDLPVEDGFRLNVSSFPMPAADIGAAWSLALDLWNADAVAALYLPNDGVTTDLTYGGGEDGVNASMHHDRDFGSALAASVQNAVSGEMVDCDIRFYARNLNGEIDWSLAYDGASPGQYDLTHTTIHELGHCLGLNHSDDPDALMYPYNGDGTGWERRHLQPDDLAGVHQMYPAAEVELALELALADDGDGDGVGTIGEVWSVTVGAGNPTDAPSVDVVLTVSVDAAGVSFDAASVALDDLPPHTPSVVSTLALTVGDGCTAVGPATLTLTAEDLAGHAWSTTAELELSCGSSPATADPDPTGTEPDGSAERASGCGCGTSPLSPGWSALALLVARRRRSLTG